MTRIAIFCDGTWNSPKIAEPTSIHKVYNTLNDHGRPDQKAVYFAGIGVADEFDGPIRKFFNKYGGGAFGWGLDGKVKQAYQFLSTFYKAGDEIYLFGFSRGAYTARSIAGMIRKCGLLENPSTENVNKAFKLYRKGGARNAPDKEHIQRDRYALSPHFATSENDLAFRKGQNPQDRSTMVDIAYMGVFDTVGARGIPPSLLGPVATLWNSQYKFHDAALSSLVRSARHALAVDERRILFVPAKWDNLDKLNGANTGPLRPYQQVWFIGNHSIVGGSDGPSQPLSMIALNWIMDGAGRLALEPGHSFEHITPDPLAVTPTLPGKSKLLRRWRDGPHSEEEMHPSVRERVQGVAEYRPKSLWRLFRP